jgi:nucleoside 2-deoxyribosyltransferase
VDKALVFILTPFHPEFQKSFNAIAAVCTELGLRPLRGDEEFIAGDVFPHILRLIVRARIVIANIEGRNPNVFYELGIAHALGKTTILVAEANKEIPFDIKAKKLILYKSLFNLKQRLRIELARSLAMEGVGANVPTEEGKRKQKPSGAQIKSAKSSEVEKD